MLSQAPRHRSVQPGYSKARNQPSENRDRPKRASGLMIEMFEQKPTQVNTADIGGRLIEAQERERSRIARELHDDFNQRLALLSIELEQLEKNFESSVAASHLFQKVQKQVQEMSADIHVLAYRLHPAKLDHLGLGEAVRSLCDELAESANLKVEFHQKGFPAVLPKDVELCLFRIAQEALRNCAKHSGAHFSQVTLSKTRKFVRLSVIDNGCGFDPGSEINASGLGFVSMKERLNSVGGGMQVHSKPHCGTRIEVIVPLRKGLPSDR